MEDHLAGLGTLDPEVLRHLPLGEEVPDLWADDVADPAHDESYSLLGRLGPRRADAAGEIGDEGGHRRHRPRPWPGRSASSDPATALTSAEPTTTPSAPRPMARGLGRRS